MQPPTNTILTIRPYRKGPSVWVFSEPLMGIHEEPFVCGVNEQIDDMLERAGLPEGEQFTAAFSASPFPGTNMELRWTRAESGGNWYTDALTGREGWLCPCLLRFFQEAPKNIYVGATV